MIAPAQPVRRRLPCTVLVADDSDSVRQAMCLVLEYHGFAVRGAANGLDALALAQANRPRIVLLDLVLPDIDGAQLARMLRADPMTCHAVLVGTSASASAEARAEAMRAGCDTFVEQPVPPRKLLATIRAYARLGRTYDFDPLDEDAVSPRLLRTTPSYHATSQITENGHRPDTNGGPAASTDRGAEQPGA